jgi:hypothetical protein
MVCDIILSPHVVFPFPTPNFLHFGIIEPCIPRVPIIPDPTTYALTNPYTNVHVNTNPLNPSINPPVHSVHPLTKNLVVSSSAAAVGRTRKTYTSAEVMKVRRA